MNLINLRCLLTVESLFVLSVGFCRGSRVELIKVNIKIIVILNKYITLVRAVHLFSTFSPCACFVSNPMEKIVERLGCEVTFNPLGDGDYFYTSAAKALEIEKQSLKKVVFDFLKSHQFDVGIQLI